MQIESKIVGKSLQTERELNGKRRLLSDLVVEVGQEQLTIPADTETDFSSIPWFGRFLIHWSRVDVAGVVHDYLYQTGTKSRSEADEIWRLVAMSGDHHASAFQAWVGWCALRAFGWLAWNRHRASARVIGPRLQTERQPDGRRRLLRDLVVLVDGRTITVPERTLTDFDSVPWIGRVLIHWSKVDIAGVVHHHLYDTKQLPRSDADRIWRVIARSGDHHANFFQAWIGWGAIRLLGWIAWRSS